MTAKTKKANNKRLVALTIILAVLICLLILQKLIPGISYHFGLNNFNKGNFQTAYKEFKIAVTGNPKNRDYRYYYVETMLKLPPTLEIQKNLFDISEKNLPDSADLIADRQISAWRNNIFLNIGENYIEKVPFNDQILRWDTSKFPLKVYIKQSVNSLPDYFIPQIKHALSQWQASTYGLIKFKIVNSENDANILINIIPIDTMKKCSGMDCKYTIAYTNPVINGNMLKRMDIKFYPTDNNGTPFPPREVYNTALHETGHALGIMGHSLNNNDVMYMENNQNKINDEFKGDFQFLSQRDVNTVQLLYKLIPDITNTEMSEYNPSHQFFAPIVMGSDKQMNSSKLLEAKNYVDAAPNLPNGYIDMAAAYTEEGQYNNATQALTHALELCSNDDERYVVYYNFAVVYMKIKDWNTAIRYAKLAQQSNPAADIDGMIAMFEYSLGEKQKAIQDYKISIQRHPENIINSVNLATIYLKSFNLIAAGKVLNNFVKTNPEQAKDPMIKRYGVLMFFFR